MTKAIEKEFINFVNYHGFNYADSALIRLQQAEEILKGEDFSEAIVASLHSIEKQIAKEQELLFVANKSDIRRILHQEILLRFKPEREVLSFALPTDIQVQTAVSLLSDNIKYAQLTGENAETDE
jgi:hypothetical protein